MKIREYTNEEVSIYFGVSIITINEWIKEGKFIGTKEENGQIKIPENALWIARTERIYSVKEIVDDFEEEYTDSKGQITDLELYISQNAAFEQLYKGTYEETLGSKPVSKMSAQEESDASIWRYLKKRRE
jgi:hypothetical protein